MKENLKENFIHIIKVITGQAYKELKREWEQQNITIDKLTLEGNRKDKKIKSLMEEKEKLIEDYSEKVLSYQDKIYAYEEITKEKENNEKNLKSSLEVADFKIKRLEADLKEKEKQRHSLASKIGGYVTEINKLKDTIEFLKKHRRAPSLEELKDYTERRKAVCKKN